MALVRCAVFLLVVVISVQLSCGEELQGNNDGICMTHSVCNSIETAQMCGAYDWCKKQGVICGASALFAKDSHFWRPYFEEIHAVCANNFEAFKKLYAKGELMDINLLVRAGKEPFTISLDFQGNPTADDNNHAVKFKLNGKLVSENIV